MRDSESGSVDRSPAFDAGGPQGSPVFFWTLRTRPGDPGILKESRHRFKPAEHLRALSR
jgi:hypothetical protein